MNRYKGKPNDWTQIDVPVTFKDKPLWFHKQGLSQTASGYGSKLVSHLVAVLPDGRERRVYVTIYSNAGTAWIILDGVRRIVD